jgi:uncharacterized RDD family membrane protein YckC
MLSAPDELAGKKARCKVCGQVITVPGARAEEQRPIEVKVPPLPTSGIKVQPAQISTQPPPVVAGIRAMGLFAYAGFWRRFAAWFIDTIILMVGGLIISFAFGVVITRVGVSGESREGAGKILGILVGWLYHALMESSTRQATLGKMALGLMVTDLNGQRVSFARATGRHFAKIVSALILFIGFIMAGFTSRKQALHDMIASCLVVRQW